MEYLTRQLRRHERDEFTQHLLMLDAEDRRLRFSSPRSDDAIRDYVDRIDLSRDAIIVVDDADLVVIGAAHLARGPGYVEVGVSVLPGYRGRGVGNALLGRAKLHARNWGEHEIFTHCAADNRAMAELAKRHGLRGVVDRGEADAYAEVPAPDASSFTIEMMAERAAALDHALKEQLVAARRLAFAWMPTRENG